MTRRWQLSRRWRSPRGLQFTRSGSVFLALTLGVGLAALNTGNNLLYLVLGLQLATVVVSGLLSERCLRDARAERLHAEPAFAGEEARITYRVHAGKAAFFAVSVGEEGQKQTGQLTYLPRGTSAVISVPLTTERRGPLTLTGVTLRTLYPLGLFSKSRTFELKDTLWIYPRRTVAPHVPLPEGTTRGDEQRSDQAGGSGDLVGLRELAPLEDARRIHWLKSAALGKALRVEREREREATLELTLPASKGQHAPALDRACEQLAALVQLYLQQGHAVGLTGPHLRLSAAGGEPQRLRILDALARAGFATPAPESAAVEPRRGAA